MDGGCQIEGRAFTSMPGRVCAAWLTWRTMKELADIKDCKEVVLLVRSRHVYGLLLQDQPNLRAQARSY